VFTGRGSKERRCRGEAATAPGGGDLGGQGAEHVADRRVVPRFGVEVLVVKMRAGSDHESRPELGDPLAWSAHVVTRTPNLAALGPRPGPDQGQQTRLAHAGGLGGGAGVVHEHREGNAGVGDEGPGIARVTCTNGDDLGSPIGNGFVLVTQLRDMVSAVQSAEVPEEDQHDWAGLPEVPQPVHGAARVAELHCLESGHVHSRTLPGRPERLIPWRRVDDTPGVDDGKKVGHASHHVSRADGREDLEGMLGPRQLGVGHRSGRGSP
jgi:hypothetical protein